MLRLILDREDAEIAYNRSARILSETEIKFGSVVKREICTKPGFPVLFT